MVVVCMVVVCMVVVCMVVGGWLVCWLVVATFRLEVGSARTWLSFMGVFDFRSEAVFYNVCLFPVEAVTKIALNLVQPFLLICGVVGLAGVHKVLWKCFGSVNSGESVKALHLRHISSGGGGGFGDRTPLSDGESKLGSPLVAAADGSPSGGGGGGGDRSIAISGGGAIGTGTGTGSASADESGNTCLSILNRFDCDAYTRTVVTMILSSYTAVATVVFTYVACVDVELGPNSVESLVFAEPAVSCESDGYRGVLIGVYCAVVVVLIGVPLALMIVLWGCVKQRRLRSDPVFMSRFGLLFAPYREDRFWFEVWSTARRAPLAALGYAVLRYPNTRVPLFGAANLICLAVQMIARPYRLAANNQFETITHMLLLLVTITLASGSHGVADSLPSAAQAFISLCVLIELACFLFYFIRRFDRATVRSYLRKLPLRCCDVCESLAPDPPAHKQDTRRQPLLFDSATPSDSAAATNPSDSPLL